MKRIAVTLLVVGFLGAFTAAHGDHCDLLGGGQHDLMACAAGPPEAPLLMGLIALALLSMPKLTLWPQLVPILIYRPPPPDPRPLDGSGGFTPHPAQHLLNSAPPAFRLALSVSPGLSTQCGNAALAGTMARGGYNG